MVRESLPEQIRAFLDVRLACPIGASISRGAEDCLDVLFVRWRTGFHLAGHGSADRRRDRQAFWSTVSRHAVRAVIAVAPDRRLFRRLAGRTCDRSLR